jgi:hypothetical protein
METGLAVALLAQNLVFAAAAADRPVSRRRVQLAPAAREHRLPAVRDHRQPGRQAGPGDHAEGGDRPAHPARWHSCCCCSCYFMARLRASRVCLRTPIRPAARSGPPRGTKGQASNESIGTMLAKWWLNRQANAAMLLQAQRAAIESIATCCDRSRYDELARNDARQPAGRDRRPQGGGRAAIASPIWPGAMPTPGSTSATCTRAATTSKPSAASAARWSCAEDRPRLVRPGPGADPAGPPRGGGRSASSETSSCSRSAPYGYYQLGMTYHHLGRSDEACAGLEQLAGFEPKFSATLKRDIEQTRRAASRFPPAPPTRRNHPPIQLSEETEATKEKHATHRKHMKSTGAGTCGSPRPAGHLVRRHLRDGVLRRSRWPRS